MGEPVGSLLWPMVALVAWTAAVLLFCYTLIDIARRDFRAWAKAVWIGVCVVAPIAGPLTYVAVIAVRQRREGMRADGEATLTARAARRPADGRLSPGELAVLKRQTVRH
jgi:hypothetical protein